MQVESRAPGLLTEETLARLSRSQQKDPRTAALANAVIHNGIDKVAINQRSLNEIQPTFSTEIETGPITSQGSSGRCWLFAGLNVLRPEVSQKFGLKDFEMSQSYLMFWDKLEKTNYFLESILETLDEDLDSRLVSWLLESPLNDGGQWDMFVNLVEKYGVVPKYVMPDAFHSGQSRGMNKLLTQKLRQYAATLRTKHGHGVEIETLRASKEDMLHEVYSLLCTFLGTPPSSFTYEYVDNDKMFHRDAGVTPIEFYRKYIDVDLGQYVSVINAPTADKPFNHTYTVQYLGNVRGGRDVLYLNVEIETMKSLVLAQLNDRETVWFGCDVGKMMDGESGVLDTDVYEYEAALGTPFDMTKAERLDYGESRMTHAMVITGVNLVGDTPNRWKVENSWGKERGSNGFLLMSDSWFDEFVYQAVVHRKYLSEGLRDALQQEPVVLHPWDPMGALA